MIDISLSVYSYKIIIEENIKRILLKYIKRKNKKIKNLENKKIKKIIFGGKLLGLCR